MNTSSASATDYFYQGTQLLGEGKAAAAEQAFQQALTLAPYLAEAHLNLGWLKQCEGRLGEAEEYYLRALELDPLLLQTRLNFSSMLMSLKRFPEAEIHCRYAIAIAPESAAALSNLGVLLASTKREQEAEQCYRAALAIDPDYHKTHFNLAYLLLRQGRYEEGWLRLEARDSNRRFDNAFRFPRWQGESLKGKTVLVAYEAGHGDMIQFCRYVDLIMQRGAIRITIICYPNLKNLFIGMRSVDEVIDFGDSFPVSGWDYWTMAMSLPYLFGTTLDTIPDALPYLFADRDRVRHWEKVLQPARGVLQVGLAWKGNPLHENDADRSMPSLDLLAPLGDITGVRYVSLQKGEAEREAASADKPFAIDNLAPHLHDFAETAAVIANLDLVITVDTAVAHLAGALGKPCWVLLPYYLADWRWLANRDDTPWYPHVMRLFRQRTTGDWSNVVGNIKSALQTLKNDSIDGA